MRIEVVTSVAGNLTGRRFSFPPGVHDDVPDDIGEMLVKAGHAKKAKGRKRGKSNSVVDSQEPPWAGSDATDGD